MIAIKRACKFFDSCKFADEKSRTCRDGGGDYCGVFGTLSELQKAKEKMKLEDQVVSFELAQMIIKKEEELTPEEISEFRTRLMLDRLEMQTLMHYIRIPLETLKRRYSSATSDMGRLLIKTAIEYKEEVMRNDN